MPFDISTTLVTIRAIAGVAKDAGKIELYSDIIALQAQLLELLASNTQLIADNAAVRQELLELRARLELRDTLKFERNV